MSFFDVVQRAREHFQAAHGARIAVDQQRHIIGFDRAGIPGFYNNRRLPEGERPCYSRGPLWLGQWSFAQRVVDSVKYVQAIDIHYSTNDDGITEIEDLTVFIGEGWPWGAGRAVWISGLRKVDPIIGHLFGESPICRAPLPRRLLQMVEDIPKFSEVTCAPTLVDRASRKRWLLAKRVVEDRVLAGAGLQPRPGPHVPAKAKVGSIRDCRASWSVVWG